MANKNAPSAGYGLIAILLTLLINVNFATELDVCSAGCAFSTLDDALSASDSFDVIVLSEGRYVVDSIVVERPLTIRGQGISSTTILAGKDTDKYSDSRPVINVLKGASLNIEQLTIDGDGRSIYEAIRFSGSGKVEDVKFKNIISGSQNFGDYGNAILVLDEKVDVLDSVFENIGSVGVYYYGDGSGSESIASGNKYIGKGESGRLDYAFALASGASAQIKNNIITNCNSMSGKFVSAGIAIDTTIESGKIDIKNNEFMDCVHAIYAVSRGESNLEVDIKENRFKNIISQAVVFLDLTDDKRSDFYAGQNWWGTSSFEDMKRRVYGKVDMDSFYTDEDMENIAMIIQDTAEADIEGMIYYLWDDIKDVGEGTPAIKITADDVTIRGDGKEIFGNVEIISTSGTKISDLVIDPAYGMVFIGADDGLYTDITMSNIREIGLWLKEDSDNNRFEGLSIQTIDDGDAIVIEGASDGNIIDCQQGLLEGSDNAGTQGFHVIDGSSNSLKNCQVSRYSNSIDLDAGSSDTEILYNFITGDMWVDDQGTSNVFDDGTSGNTYILADGTPSWHKYEIYDLDADTWSDFGIDLPFSEPSVDEWIGNGADNHPYTENVMDSVINIDSCMELNMAGFTYNLVSDIQTDDSICFDITADEIIFQGNDHTIEKNTPEQDSIAIRIAADNVQTSGFEISGYHHGVYLDGSTDATVTDNEMTTVGDSIVIDSGNDNMIQDNAAYSEQGSALMIVDSALSTAYFNDLRVGDTSTESAVRLSSSTGADILGNDIHSSMIQDASAILVDGGSSGDDIQQNTIFSYEDNNGIELVGAQDMYIQGNEITAEDGDGITLDSSSQIVVTENTILSDGFGIESDHSTENEFTLNQITGTDAIYACMILSSSDGTVIEDNTLDCQADGIQIDSSENIEIANNNIESQQAVGMMFVDVDSSTINRNDIQAGQFGITMAVGSNDNQIENNDVQATMTGIMLMQGVSRNQISHNTVISDEEQGIHINGEADGDQMAISIFHNTVRALQGKGIFLENSKGVTVGDNTVESLYAIRLESSDENNVISNDITALIEDGSAIHLVHSHDNRVDNNRAQGYMQAFIFEESDRNTGDMNDLTVTSQAGVGISYIGSSYNVLSDSQIVSTNSYGLMIGADSHYNRVEDSTITTKEQSIYIIQDVSFNEIKNNQITSTDSNTIYMSACHDNVITGNTLTPEPVNGLAFEIHEGVVDNEISGNIIN